MRIALIAGHDADSPGAKRGVVTEFGLASAVIGDLTFRLDKIGHKVFNPGTESNREQVRRVNSQNVDIGLELHFNSHINSTINGAEVLHAGSKSGILLAESIQKSLVRILKVGDRGIVKAHYRLNKKKPLITIVKNTKCPFVVVEPLFLSNKNDFARIDVSSISIGILIGIIDYDSICGI